MGHPSVVNATPFAFEALFIADEEARPLFVPIVKATYSISREDGLVLAEKQIALDPEGKFNGEPGKSSYRYEPETAFFKMSTDVALIGTAWARPGTATQADVRLTIGPLFKAARVFGDRHWRRSFGGISMSAPEPFESLPLIYELAFGGGDRMERFDSRNPIGKGYYSDQTLVQDGDPVPNIEDPNELICSSRDKPVPAGFGFIAPDWQPRAKYGGTFDEAWSESRMPLLPYDFDRRYFNAAAPGLQSSGYFRGDEQVLVENVSPHGPISFRLPGITPPECLVHLAGKDDTSVRTELDTVIIDTDANLLILLWRGYLALRNGPHDIAGIKIESPGVPLAVAR